MSRELSVESTALTVSGLNDGAAELTPSQQLALGILASGRSVVMAAQAAGVDRRTVHRWLRLNAEFRSAYAAWRMDVREAAAARVTGLADEAVNTVRRAIRDGDARIALALLRHLNLTSGEACGPTDCNDRTARQLERIDDLLDMDSPPTPAEGSNGLPEGNPNRVPSNPDDRTLGEILAEEEAESRQQVATSHMTQSS